LAGLWYGAKESESESSELETVIRAGGVPSDSGDEGDSADEVDDGEVVEDGSDGDTMGLCDDCVLELEVVVN